MNEGARLFGRVLDGVPGIDQRVIPCRYLVGGRYLVGFALDGED